jgi:dipeptidyl aminopeptidase/acylaminoacyl peptidase
MLPPATVLMARSAVPDYRDFLAPQRLQRVISISADGSQIAYSSDASGQFNLWIQPAAGGAPRQLTFFTDHAVRDMAWSPDGSRLAFTADRAGDEQAQVYVVPAGGGDPVRLSAVDDRQFVLAEKTPFDSSGRYLLCGGNDRDQAVPDLIVYDLSDGSQVRFPGRDGGNLFPLAFSPDGQRVLGGVIASNSDIQCCLGAMEDPANLDYLAETMAAEYAHPGPWSGNSSGFYVNAIPGGGDLTGLWFFSLAERSLTPVDTPAWDVEDVTASADGRTVIWSVSEDGWSVLYGLRDGKPFDCLPVPGGVIRAMDVSADGSVLAMVLDTPARPLAVAVADLGTGTAIRFLTDARPPALQIVDPVVPESCHFPSRDGTSIPALMYRPSGPGPHPVLLYIHGGPEDQARPLYNALQQCLLASGIGLLAPNVRGSTGYGRAWQMRIYRDWGGIDLEDFAGAAAWLRSVDWVDPARIAVFGGSYGGFAALSCVSRLPELWAAGVSVCGPTNLESLARSMPPSWIKVVRQMFGDPDTDAEELRRRSPVTYADQITAPLLVVQGANDPRVPKAESDQIVERVRARGVEVSYLVFDDEGHAFTNRNNDITANTMVVEFLVMQLGQ